MRESKASEEGKEKVTMAQYKRCPLLGAHCSFKESKIIHILQMKKLVFITVKRLILDPTGPQ